MNSLPTIVEIKDFEKLNDAKFSEMLSFCAPELWRLWQYLMETRVNIRVLPKVVRGIANIAESPSHVGRVIIFVEGDKVSLQIRENDTGREEVFDKQ
jgi:hypothetical protein